MRVVLLNGKNENGGVAVRRLILLVVVAFILGGCDSGTKHTMTVDSLQKMAKINVLYVAIAERYQLETENGKSSLWRIVKGGAYYSINMEEIEVISESNGKNGDRIKLELPEPSIEEYPDPTRSVEWRPKTKLFVNDSGLNRIREMYDAKDREKITAAANQAKYVKMAKEQAEKILRDILPKVDVTVKWKK